MSKASMARRLANKSKVQSRGLSGKRNEHGDFMPEEVQMKGVQESVDVDVQNYIDDVKSQIDEIESQIDNIDASYPYHQQVPDEAWVEMDALKAQQGKLIDDLITKLEEEGVEVPEEIWQMTAKYSPDENQVMY